MQFFALTTTKEAFVLFAYDLLLLTYYALFFYFMISLMVHQLCPFLVMVGLFQINLMNYSYLDTACIGAACVQATACSWRV